MNLLSIVFRRGWRTSEFWVALLSLALMVFARPHTTAATLSLAAIASSYIVSRGIVKGRAARRLLDRENGHTDEHRGPRRV